MKKLTLDQIQIAIHNNAERYERMYLREDMTVREICEQEGWVYDPMIQKQFYRSFGPKGKGWGGKRKNAGNPPGTRFCFRCRKTKENCRCTPAQLREHIKNLEQ